MAKGKGKGKRKNDNNGDCCDCIRCCIFLPPILVIIGVIILFVENTRIERIEEYNARAKEWIEGGLDSFRDVSFYLNEGADALAAETATSGSYYPIRDSCNKEGDPEEGCLTTDALYYHGSISNSGESVHVNLVGSSDETIVDSDYTTSYTDTYTRSQLDCEDDDDSECRSECERRGGNWDTWSKRCTVYWYLSVLCYRVTKEGDQWQLDVPPTWSLRGSGPGCFYSNKHEAALYTHHQVSNIPVHVRHYKDSFIAADELTLGCSYSTPSSSSCFGLSSKEQNLIGYSIAGIGGFLLLAEVVLVIALCCCCRSMLSSLTSRNKKNEIPLAQAVQAQSQPQPQSQQRSQPQQQPPNAYYNAQPAYFAHNDYGQYGMETQPTYNNPAYNYQSAYNPPMGTPVRYNPAGPSYA